MPGTPPAAQVLNTLRKSGYCHNGLKITRMVRPAGFEPATFASGGQRSIRMSYGRPETAKINYSRAEEFRQCRIHHAGGVLLQHGIGYNLDNRYKEAYNIMSIKKIAALGILGTLLAGVAVAKPLNLTMKLHHSCEYFKAFAQPIQFQSNTKGATALQYDNGYGGKIFDDGAAMRLPLHGFGINAPKTVLSVAPARLQQQSLPFGIRLGEQQSSDSEARLFDLKLTRRDNKPALALQPRGQQQSHFTVNNLRCRIIPQGTDIMLSCMCVVH